MNIPTEEDWRSEPWDLDIPHAYKHFLGKNIDESIALFEEDAHQLSRRHYVHAAPMLSLLCDCIY